MDEKRNKWVIISDRSSAGYEPFTVEADTPEQACRVALEQLGWHLYGPEITK